MRSSREGFASTVLPAGMDKVVMAQSPIDRRSNDPMTDEPGADPTSVRSR